MSREDLTVFSRRRLEDLLTDTDAALASIFNEYYDELSGHLLEIGEFEASFEAQNLEQTLKDIDVNYTSAIPSAKQLEAAIFSQPLGVRDANGGKVLETFVEDWTKVETQRLVAENNDSSIDRSPMGDLARLNLAHYRNSADYEDSCYFVGQAQPWIRGLSEECKRSIKYNLD